MVKTPEMIMPKSGGGGAEDAAAWRKAQDELDQWGDLNIRLLSYFSNAGAVISRLQVLYLIILSCSPMSQLVIASLAAQGFTNMMHFETVLS